MSLGETLRVLNRMVDDGVLANYAIGGAVAALNYIEPTVTEDVDVLISFEGQSRAGLITLGPIVSYLAEAGYTQWEKEGLIVEGWPVQFLPVSDGLDQEALELAELVEDEFGTGATIATRVLSAEHIVATALRTGRPKDFLRIDAFLTQEAVDLERLKAVLLRNGLADKWTAFCRKSGRPDTLAL
jgi:hypothetical protein